ncbi:unnamed protein product [Adineta ricciae]|uniref:Cadherin domain-containing protein n=4 Tax=Adineta ricciae TaxID=249248 RepID=A0A813WW51_ADIRI|nr:unnamed protein product [Adineta ricciae]
MSISLFLLTLLLLIQSIHTAIQRLPPISLHEQSSIGTSIYDLSRIYPSTSKNLIQFAFLSDTSPHNSFFIVDSLTGRISIKRMIDREELCQTHICNCDRCLLTLELIASSQTVDILSLEITIENINDNQPIFPVSSFQIRLSESTDIGHVSSFPSATDLDYQDHIEYHLVPLNPSDNETFTIVNLQTENQLGLRLLKSLDREQQNLYKMKVIASDGEHTGELLFDVHILDSNDNVPKFEHDQYHIKVREDIPIGSELLHIHAYDNDEGLNALINYTIVTDNPSSSFPFEINVRTGAIRLIQALDYEYETNYHFSVRARDNGPDAVSVYTQVQIDILDVNDCPPDIDLILPDNNSQKNLFQIEEEQPLHTRLFHLSVSDKDSGIGKILLRLLTYQDLFQLNEQYNDLYNLIVIGRLDREKQEEYQLIFEAVDQGVEQSLKTQKNLTIRLIDINDCSPILDPFPKPIHINENNPYNVRLIQLHARDLDAPNTPNSLLTYSLLPSNDSRFFRIDSQTGILSVGQISFDYETKSVYHLVLNISDHGTNPKRLETIQPLVIHINNTNDNEPVFKQSSYSFRIPENVPVGTLIGQVSAIDLDSNSTIDYELSTPEYQSTFYIDHLTGQLHTKVLLDYETVAIYRLNITAKDNDGLHSTHTIVIIELIDVNDNPPMIDSSSSIRIPSQMLHTNTSETIMIARINAKDKDSGRNGQLTYGISDGNQQNYFQMNSMNGTITAKTKNLPQGHHRLTIKVCDQGESLQKCSTTIINIQIGENVNDLFYSEENVTEKQLAVDENIVTNEMIIVVIISSIFTLVFSITMGILCAVFCKQKRCHHIHRSSLKTPCESLQSTDADKLLSTNNTNTFSSTNKKLTGHHLHQPYEDIIASGCAASSEDSCYGSNELSRSSSSTHGVAKPLLTEQHRSGSLSSTSVDYAIPTPRQTSLYPNKTVTLVNQSSIEPPTNHMKTFHSTGISSSNHYNLKKTVQSLTRRPVAGLQSTYLPYDTIDTPPSPQNHSPATSTTSREYSI